MARINPDFCATHPHCAMKVSHNDTKKAGHKRMPWPALLAWYLKLFQPALIFGLADFAVAIPVSVDKVIGQRRIGDGLLFAD